MRETRNIPNLIAKLEIFMGNLQKLASKAKCEHKLLQGIKLGTARDFRLKLEQVPQPEEVHDASAEVRAFFTQVFGLCGFNWCGFFFLFVRIFKTIPKYLVHEDFVV